MSRSPIYVEFDGRGLVPVDAYAAEQLAALVKGSRYNARLSRITASGKEEREGMRGLWWAGCDLLSQQVDELHYDTRRKASNMILMSLGFVTAKPKADGRVDIVPISTGEDVLDDEEMQILLERAAAFCIQRFGFDPFQSWKDQQPKMPAPARQR